jgi:hypothetical protein
MRLDGTGLDEFSTMIDPQRPTGAAHVHGISEAAFD